MSKIKKRRQEKGLFGLPKKKSILFTFQPRAGEECSSDSEDSDYVPGRHSSDEDDDFPRNKIKKSIQKEKSQQKNKVKSAKQQTRSVRSSQEGGNVSDEVKTTMCFPDEILIKIFKFCVYNEGIIKFLPRASRVCKAWHRLSHDPAVLQKIDFGSAQCQPLTRSVQKVILQQNLSFCKVLILSGQTKVQSSFIESLLCNTPGIVSLDLFNCPTIRSECVKKIPQLCPGLTRIDLSNPSDFNTSLKFSSLELLITSCGPRLVELRLARILAVKTNIDSIFKLLWNNCPNLEELDMRMNPMYPEVQAVNCHLDIVGFINGCPKLKELCIDGVAISEKDQIPFTSGLKNLKIFSQAAVQCLDINPIFHLIFAPETKLLELNISSSIYLPNDITDRVTEVECLHMADIKWKYNDASMSKVLSDCISKWRSSLKLLNLSNNKLLHCALDNALGQFRDEQDCNLLEVLNLANTNVKSQTVQQVIKSCKKLKSIDLTSSRELPRGTKRIFYSSEFPQLLKMLTSRIKCKEQFR
ncbi:hypothetical protein Btru_004044 [Bulinus truncatus]|nr:hypothetical protein Btru_004044 [Bulinus truncatus]